MTAFIDTNVLIRHLTGDQPDLAVQATNLLNEAEGLLVPDLIVAEVVFVLSSFYGLSVEVVDQLVRSVLKYESVRTSNRDLLFRSLDIYRTYRLGFADAYLAASAESTDGSSVISFDRALDRIPTVTRIEP